MYISKMFPLVHILCYSETWVYNKSLLDLHRKKKKKSIKIPITVFPNYCYSSSVKRKPLIN